MSDKPKWSLMYAKDLKIPPGGTSGNTEMAEFTSFLSMISFVIRDKVARASVLANRVQIIQIVDSPKKK